MYFCPIIMVLQVYDERQDREEWPGEIGSGVDQKYTCIASLSPEQV